MSILLSDAPLPGVALLRINRPERRNALNFELRRLLAERLNALAVDDAVRCVVLAGNRQAFAAGADVHEIANLGPIELMQRRVGEMWDAVGSFRKPLIAAVEGLALGGGCELAMHADIIVVGESARIGLPEVRLGIVPGGGGTQRLIRAVGKFKAMQIVLCGESVSGREAHEMGLASTCVPDGEAEKYALKLAEHIATLPPLAVALAKEVMLAGQDVALSTALALERKAVQVLFASNDKREGMNAFLEKRTPTFKGE